VARRRNRLEEAAVPPHDGSRVQFHVVRSLSRLVNDGTKLGPFLRVFVLDCHALTWLEFWEAIWLVQRDLVVDDGLNSAFDSLAMFRNEEIWDASNAIPELSPEKDFAWAQVQRSTRSVDVDEEGLRAFFFVDFSGLGETVDEFLHLLDRLFGDTI